VTIETRIIEAQTKRTALGRAEHGRDGADRLATAARKREAAEAAARKAAE
jgi:hypothetical protein